MASNATQTTTYCRICESLCGLVAHLDDQGQLIRLRPDREHPHSQGFICAKGTRFADVASHPKRITHPMLRNVESGALEQTTWKQALQAVGERLRPIIETHGPHAIGVYFGNPLAFNAYGTMGIAAFLRGLGTRNIYAAGSQDCNNKFAGSAIVHGSPVIQPIPDFERTDLAIILGSNPAVSQSSFVHLAGGSTVFDRMIERGARVIWVDPRRSESAQRWGEHIPVRPGSDVILLLSLLNSVAHLAQPNDRFSEGLETLLALSARFPIERAAPLCGLEPDELQALVDAMASSKKMALHMSVGVNTGPFGTLSYIAMQAISYLTGNFDREGGSLFHPIGVAMAKMGERFKLDQPHNYSRIGHFPDTLWTLPAGILADEITTPGAEQIRALIVVAGDPLQSIPGAEALEAALPQLDTVISIDLFENSTARYANIFLPATSWLERHDAAATALVLQDSSILQTTTPVVKAPGEARHEARILAEMSLAIERPILGSKWLTRALLAMPWNRLLSRLDSTLSKVLSPFIGKKEMDAGLPVPKPKASRYLGKGPRTPGHRLRFWEARLDGESARLEAWLKEESERSEGFRLIGRRRRIGHNSWLHKGGRSQDSVRHEAWLHQDDLDALGDGVEHVELRSEVGRAVLPVVSNAGVPRGTVVVPHGLPKHNINALIPATPRHIERLSGNLWMTAVPVELHPHPPAST